MRDLYEYRDLVWTLVTRDLKVRYRRSILGFVWTMLQPLLTMAVLMIVFSSIFRFAGVDNYPVYALAGILFWNFFQQSIVSSMNSLKSSAYILQKLPVPMAVFP
ncbi:MAG: ABC transporter permease, partial [Acidobacteriota bacterium]